MPIPCAALSFPVRSISRSQVRHACALAILAREAVARGRARVIGVLPKDTAQISSALVAYFEIADERGEVLEKFVAVDLGLLNKPFALSYHLTTEGVEQILRTEPFDSTLSAARKP
jgi:hypothetical protein